MSPVHCVVPLPVPRTSPPRTAVGRWLEGAEPLDARGAPETGHPWYRVLWLSGVDYFSTLAYQPGIALLAAGALAPIATAFLVVVTLLGALPVYSQVAWRSYAGQGSIAMLENLLRGWRAKAAVLVLLGFAATDFIITITLSAADAAKHAVENPLLQPVLGHGQLAVTLALLALLAAVFLRGFGEARPWSPPRTWGSPPWWWGARPGRSPRTRSTSTTGGRRSRCAAIRWRSWGCRRWPSRAWRWACPASRPAWR
jgi:hypothetical protein